MAIPSTPNNFILQQGNGQTYLSWDITSGATFYLIQRSTDGVSYSTIATPSLNNYLDTTVTVGTLYYYQIASQNISGTSAYTASQSITPTLTGDLSLGQTRLLSQQRADRVNSPFVTTSEWNTYISQSYFELYDLLIDTYEDYFVKPPIQFTTDGSSQQYNLPSDFYKLLGVDLGLDNTANAFVTVKKFEFISRNRYVYPQITSNLLGPFNLRYRIIGNTIMFIPVPSAGQIVRLWYIPKLQQPLKDTDILTGTSGWLEYVITDAAIKALQKEESDITVLAAQKMALIKRIEETSVNRDAGQPDCISPTRTNAERWGTSGWGWDGSGAGW